MLIIKGAHANINNTDAYPERTLSAGFELACMYLRIIHYVMIGPFCLLFAVSAAVAPLFVDGCEIDLPDWDLNLQNIE